MKINKKDLPHISLEDRVAVVTGAASGIGLAASKKLAEAQAKVALLDISQEKGKAAVEEIIRLGGDACFIECDVTSAVQCEAACEKIIQSYGRIDILFNNAGVIFRKDIIELAEEEWDFMIDVNLKSVYLLSRLVIPHMRKSGGGSIVNTGSGWGLKGGQKAAAYCAAKGGVVNLTKAMAVDYGRDNIRINCVCPGDVDTPLLHGEAVQLDIEDEDFLKEAADRPLGRVGLPLDIANAVLFLASDMASWITGAVLVVDGGGLA